MRYIKNRETLFKRHMELRKVSSQNCSTDLFQKMHECLFILFFKTQKFIMSDSRFINVYQMLLFMPIWKLLLKATNDK